MNELSKREMSVLSKGSSTLILDVLILLTKQESERKLKSLYFFYFTEEKPLETKPSYDSNPQAPGDGPSQGAPPGSPTPKTLVGVPNQQPDQEGR